MPRLFSRRRLLVYVRDLRQPVVGVPPPSGVTFQVNSEEGLGQLAVASSRFELSPRDRAEIPEQIRAGEISVTGWIGDELVAYGWVQFTHRRLAGATRIAIGPRCAFMYRCLTVSAWRHRGIYTALLVFAQQWLGRRGYERVFIDVDVANGPSRAAIARAGFVPVSAYQTYRVLWRRWATRPDDLRRAVAGDRP